MFPVLLKVGPITLYTYGLLIAVGFLLAVKYAEKLCAEQGIPLKHLTQLCLGCFIVGAFGSRFLQIIVSDEPMWTFFKVWESRTFIGGLIPGLLFGILYLRHYQLNLWKMWDIYMTGFPLAHAFGRLGCFGAGCCHGKATDSWIGMKFNSEMVDTALRGVPVHPTQLYEAFALFIIFFAFTKFYKQRSFDGQVAISYFMVYPVVRFFIEFFRGDSSRGHIFTDLLSTSQLISALLFVGALVAYYFRRRYVMAQRALESAKPQGKSKKAA